MVIYKDKCGLPTAIFFKYYYYFDVLNEKKEDKVQAPDFWKTGRWNPSKGYPTCVPVAYGHSDSKNDL